jgi:hypothetical protein
VVLIASARPGRCSLESPIGGANCRGLGLADDEHPRSMGMRTMTGKRLRRRQGTHHSSGMAGARRHEIGWAVCSWGAGAPAILSRSRYGCAIPLDPLRETGIRRPAD